MNTFGLIERNSEESRSLLEVLELTNFQDMDHIDDLTWSEWNEYWK